MKDIQLPATYNYIAAFLTLGCNLSCSYCINHLSGKAVRRPLMSGDEWIEGLNRIVSAQNISLTLQGGEPSIHKDFLKIINGVEKKHHLEILTNLQFDGELFANEIAPERLKRENKYSSIRVSFHPETMDIDETLQKSLYLIKQGFDVGLFGVLHPESEQQVLKAQKIFQLHNIDFRTKPFLGTYQGKLHGSYAYENAVAASSKMKCDCKTSELLISPEGYVFRCHHDLYNNLNPVGHILDESFEIKDIFRECVYFGNCNPCDIKVKNNRFQEFGHTSVEIKNITALNQDSLSCQ